MDLRIKNIYYSLFILSLIGVFWLYRKYNSSHEVQKEAPALMHIKGQTMGTFYAIKYLDDQSRNWKSEVDSVLVSFNQSLSTYIPDSEISTFNKEEEFAFNLAFFYPVLKRSKEIFEATQGAFDPTIMPLVNAWGFGPKGRQTPEAQTVDSLLNLVDYRLIEFDETGVRKTKTGTQLDFSAIAKGYGVDVVADFLRSKGIHNFMVEIGGEVVCSGKNEEGNWWKIGIENPVAESEEKRIAIFELANKALATSGNYKNFYEKDGKKYAHTLSPVTGYPVTHELLSATVFAADCMTADAYATAFMVAGLEKSMEWIEADSSLDAFLVYSNEDGTLSVFLSEGMKAFQIQ